MGLWVRAGSWSMQNLTEGYIPAKAAKALGTGAQAKSLVEAGLWVLIDGGYQFHEWNSRQMSAEQIADRRQKRAEAGRKGGQISKPPKPEANSEAKSEAIASDLLKQNGTPVPVPVPRELSELSELARQSNAPDSIAATPGADLVREIVPGGHPAPTLTSLRLQASELLNNGTARADVADALRLWCSKPGVGIGRTILASLVSEVIKGRAAPTGSTTGVSAFERKKAANGAVFAALGNDPSPRLEIER